MTFVVLHKLRVSGILLWTFFAIGCNPTTRNKVTVVLGLTNNMNFKCIGQVAGVCGPDDKTSAVQIAGIFATEPECQGLKLRRLTEQELKTPINQLQLAVNLFDLFYEGTPHAETYNGTGKGEDEGWLLIFNGPKGHFSLRVKTQPDAVRRVCIAAKGQGGELDVSFGSGQ
jgi:hypothetical protein